MDQEYLGKEIAKFNLADAAIAEMSSRYLALTIQDGYEVVHSAKMEVKGKRIDVEKKRKELKEDALRYGQAIDGEAKRLTALISPIEDHLEKEERIYLAAKEAEKAEKERLIAEKLQVRVDRLCSYGATFNGTVFTAFGIQVAHKAIGACSDEGFEQFIAQIEKAKEVEEARLKAEDEAKKAEAAHLLKIEEEQELERKRLAKIEDQQRAEAARLRAEQDAIEKEKLRLVNEKVREEEEKIRAVELEKAKKEAVAIALKNAADKAEKARLAAERKAARQPDQQKIIAYLGELSLVPLPEVKSSEALLLMGEIHQRISEVLNWAEDKAGAL